MMPVRVLYFLTGALACLFFLLFCWSSLREKKPRAAVISGAVLLIAGAVWFGGAVVLRPSEAILLAATAAVWLFAALFFLPLGRTSYLRVAPGGERIDERDVMFAREEYLPGSAKYKEYYRLHPERKAIDDKIRSLPELLAPGGRYYDPVRSPAVSSVFRTIESLLTHVDGPVAEAGTDGGQADFDAARMTAKIKQTALEMGAAEVGIARLDPRWVYSHVGRGPEPWGSAIRTVHEHAIAFTVEMDYAHVEAAPRLAITEETAHQYLRAAELSIRLAEKIRGMGYAARAHIAGSNYQIVLPPVAWAAGLGELGRFGYLISRKVGARVRLGAVTTNLSLVPDRPVAFGVQDFCEQCKRCAANCPSASIPSQGKIEFLGVEKWVLDRESCLRYWRVIGTDCGLCMRVCPYSHPRALVHDLVRAGIARSGFARWIAARGEDLFYGKSVRPPR